MFQFAFFEFRITPAQLDALRTRFTEKPSPLHAFALGGIRLLMYVLLASVAMNTAHSKPNERDASSSPKTREAPPISSSTAALPNPDLLLIETLKRLSKNDLRGAELKVNELLQAYPHFQLGHAIRGDLLLMYTRPVKQFGAESKAPSDKIKDLRDEATARIRAIYVKPDPNLIPRNILQLRSDQKQVLLVDAKRSRLYLYEIHNGEPKFRLDYYISQGKFGINKAKEGDQRTPLGVYHITSRLAGAKLPDFYGPGALPINYPNEWDKLNGRSGSGIWLHGVPSNNYSRPPLASDGCVVLSNPDFLQLASLVDIGKTPVIINESVEFVTRNKWMADKAQASTMLEDWRVDLESQIAARIMNNYSKRFKTLQGENINSWIAKQPLNDKTKQVSVKLSEVTQFRYPDAEEMIVSSFTQENTVGKSKSIIRKRQYWIKESNRWKIIFEAHV
jgi:murein L,D-transpeptidase YafK